MIGRLSDMSPGLLAMYGLLAWTVASTAVALIVGKGIRIAEQCGRAA